MGAPPVGPALVPSLHRLEPVLLVRVLDLQLRDPIGQAAKGVEPALDVSRFGTGELAQPAYLLADEGDGRAVRAVVRSGATLVLGLVRHGPPLACRLTKFVYHVMVPSMRTIKCIPALIVLILSLASSNASAEWLQRPSPVLRPTLPWEGRSVQEPTVLHYDGLYHVWYSGGWGAGMLGYATSRDGVRWRKHLTPVLRNVSRNNVIRFRGRLYLYYVLANGHPDSNLHLALSRDGIHWQRQPAPVLAVNPTGWDNIAIANTFVIHGPRGWRFFYEALSGTGYQWLTGVTGGNLRHWRNAPRPLPLALTSAGSAGGPWVVGTRSGGYCMFFHAGRTVLGATDIFKRCTRNFRTWGYPSLVLNRSQAWEASAGAAGQVADPTVANGLLFFDGVNNRLSSSSIGLATLDRGVGHRGT